MVRTLHGQRIDKPKYSCKKKPIVIGPNEYVATFILKKADAHINDNSVSNK